MFYVLHVFPWAYHLLFHLLLSYTTLSKFSFFPLNACFETLFYKENDFSNFISSLRCFFIKVFLWFVVSFFWWWILQLLLDFLVIFFLFILNNKILILAPLEWLAIWMMCVSCSQTSILQEVHVEGWQSPLPIKTPISVERVKA